jgi:spermidine/putrescine transport system substrate-binding protein
VVRRHFLIAEQRTDAGLCRYRRLDHRRSRKERRQRRSVIPEQGGLQWTESFSIGKGSAKADLAKKWIQYITSAKGQAKSADMAAYPALVPNQKGWEVLNAENPAEAKRQGMIIGSTNAMDMIRSGRIQYRQVPLQQSLEEWNDFWSDYKGA